MMSCVVLIISLESSQFERTRRRYEAAGGTLPVIHIPGVLATKEQREFACTGFAKYFGTQSLIGCGLAHRQAWKTAEEMNCRAAIILEDDIHFSPTFNERIILEPLLTRSVDMFVFGNMVIGLKDCSELEHLWRIWLVGFENHSDCYYDVKKMYGTHGYAISRETLISLRKNLRMVTHHIDLELSKLCKNRSLLARGCRPNMVFQAHFNESSQLEHRTSSLDTCEIDACPPITYLWNFKSLRLLDSIDITAGNLILWALLCFVLLMLVKRR